MKVASTSWQTHIAKNWSDNKPSILTSLAAIAIAATAWKLNYDIPIEDPECVLPKFAILAASGIIAVESIVYMAQKVLTKKNTDALIIGPALTVSGAGLILAAGYCPALDFPSAAFTLLNGAALSWYGIWWTAAAHFHQAPPKQDDLLPV